MTINVQARLTRPHPLVASTQASVSKTKPDETGRLLLGADGVARLRVSRAAAPRALRILDALCKAAESLGWRVETAKRHSGVPCTRFVHGAWDVEFKIVESTNKAPHVRTATEERDAARGRTYGIPEWDYEPNGRLSLVLDSYVAKRTNFNDGVRQRLEDLLDQVLEAVGRAFEIEAEREASRERDRADQRRRALSRAEERFQTLSEQRRREVVEAQVTRWRRLEDLTAYAEEISLSLPQMEGDTRDKAAQWLSWVKRHLDAGRADLRTPSLPTDLQRDDPSLVSTLGVDFDTWHAWSTHWRDAAQARDSAPDGAEY